MTITRERRKANRLRQLKITRVDSVDRGAQPDAHIILAKFDNKVRGARMIAEAATFRRLKARAAAREEAEPTQVAGKAPVVPVTPVAPPAAPELTLDDIEKADGPLAAMDRLVGDALVAGVPTRSQAVLAVAKAHPDLYGRAREELPAVRHGLADPVVKSVPIIEAEQPPDAPHEVSDRMAADHAAHDKAKAEFDRRVRQIVQDSAATSKPVTAQQAALLVSRADPKLYQAVTAPISHTKEA